MNMDTRDVDEIMLEQGILKFDQLKKAWDIQRETNRPIDEILLDLQFVTPGQIMVARAAKMGIDFVDLSAYEIMDESVPVMISEYMAKRYVLIPIEKDDSVLTVAMKDPSDIFAIDDLKLATSFDIKAVMADADEIDKLIMKYFAPVIPEPEPEPEPEPQEEIAHASELYASEEVQAEADSEEENRSALFKSRIGKIMVAQGVITEEQLNEALRTQEQTGEKLGEILVKNEYITKKTLYEFLKMQMGVEHVDLDGAPIDEETIRLVNESISRRHILVPLERDGITLRVAMSDPMNIFSIDDLRLITGLDIVPVLADEAQILDVLDRVYGKPVETVKKVEEEKKKQSVAEFEEEMKKVNEEIAVEIGSNIVEDDIIDINDVANAPIVKMVNIILQKAIMSGASDIHIEPYEDVVMVRYRIDGQLVEAMQHDKKIITAIVARVKIISGLNIAEKRVPQDGRISMKVGNGSYDLRVSVLPTVFGEKVVIRIADKEGFKVEKKRLGFYADDEEKFDSILAHPHGIVLVTGPTGSGKSTTLYTALRELCKPNVNILTVEDPVESMVRGVNQVQVNVKAGLTFAAALRSFLRQDPDIIMVGEIRDGETAEIATRAAITGHLVLSTLHTNDAASSITRMIDMGIEPFLISSSVVGVIAQRLVRRLCPKCKKEHVPDASERDALNVADGDEITIYEPVGCPECNNTGYKGRIAIYEIMTVDKELRNLISKNATPDVIKSEARKQGMLTLRDNCARSVKDGITSVEEMLRVTYAKD